MLTISIVGSGVERRDLFDMFKIIRFAPNV